MGIILSRFRKKKTRIETLEDLENDIKKIEEDRSYAQRKHKRITKLLFSFSIGLYILCGIFFYFHFTSTIKGKLLYLVPLALSPLVLYLINRVVSWYYVRMIANNQSRLNEMKKEKKRLLDEVMDKETYKVAKEILEKFSDTVPKPPPNMKLVPLSPLRQDEGLKKRIVNVSNMPLPQPSRNIGKNFSSNPSIRPRAQTAAPSATLQGTPMMRLAAPILRLDRSYVDKVFDYLIGDGPNNRFALICSQCHSHNGMALKEEFEYIGFKCCYCFHYNPARKLRPEAPKLETHSTEFRDSDSDSDSKNSGENLDAENKSDLQNKEEQELKHDFEKESSHSPDGSTEIDNSKSTENKIIEELTNNDNGDTSNVSEVEKIQEKDESEPSESNTTDCGVNSTKNNSDCDQSVLKS